MTGKGVALLLLTLAGVGALIVGVQQHFDHPTCRQCNIIVISLDQARAKSLPCFGYTQDTAPNLCRFATKSSIFSNAYATAAKTMDSHFSMITSLYPSGHTMNLPYVSVLPKDIPTMAELLKKEGYRTYFMGPQNDPHLPLTKGLERGFDATYDADTPDKWISAMQSIASVSAESKQPSFFFLHTYDAHEPWMPSDEELALFYKGPIKIRISAEDLCKYTFNKLGTLHPERIFARQFRAKLYCDKVFEYLGQYPSSNNDTFVIFNQRYWRLFDELSPEEKPTYMHALYAAQLHMLDEALQNFFDYLGKARALENTVIVIVGDQGDEFAEHGGYSHGSTLYNEILHVPFIVYVPHTRPRRSEKLVSLVDIMPTIFRVVGIPLPASLAGIDVYSKASHDMIVAEDSSGGKVALRTDTYTLIRSIFDNQYHIELYDVKKDPGEQRNIFDNHSAIVQSLLARYKTIQTTSASHGAVSDPFPTWMNERDRENLKKSGYF